MKRKRRKGKRRKGNRKTNSYKLSRNIDLRNLYAVYLNCVEVAGLYYITI